MTMPARLMAVRMARIAALLFVCGCGVTDPHDAGIVGSYSLVSVNGMPLPVDQGCATIAEGELVLRQDKSFTRRDPRANVSMGCSLGSEMDGTYRLRGSDLTFEMDFGFSVPVAVGYGTVIVDDGVYQVAYENGLGRRGYPEPVSDVFLYRK